MYINKYNLLHSLNKQTENKQIKTEKHRQRQNQLIEKKNPLETE